MSIIDSAIKVVSMSIIKPVDLTDEELLECNKIRFIFPFIGGILCLCTMYSILPQNLAIWFAIFTVLFSINWGVALKEMHKRRKEMSQPK